MLDPSKLDKMKVVELRAELQTRGLDTKGVKAVLVERLKAALELEIVSISESSESASEVSLTQQPSSISIVQASPTAQGGRRSRRQDSSSTSPQRRLSEEQIVGTEQQESSSDLQILPEDLSSTSGAPATSVDELSQSEQLYAVASATATVTTPPSTPEEKQRSRSSDKIKSSEKSKSKNPEKVVVKLKIEKYHDTYVAGKVEETPLSSYIEQQQHQQQLKQQQQQVLEEKIMRTPEQAARLPEEVKTIKTPAEKKIIEPMQTFIDEDYQEPPQVYKSPEKKTIEEIQVSKSSTRTENKTPEKPEQQEKSLRTPERKSIDSEEKEREKSLKTPERKSIDSEQEEKEKRSSHNFEANKRPKKQDQIEEEKVKNDSSESLEEQIEDNKKMEVDNIKEGQNLDTSVERKPSEDKLKKDIEERANRKRKHSKSRSDSKCRSKSRSRSRSRSRSKSRSRSRSRSRSKSRSRSPRRTQKKSPAPNIDDFTNEEDEPVVEDKQFGLSWFDSDLHLRIDPVAFNSAKPLHEDAFELVWSGVRTNYGVREGKVVYEVRLSEEITARNFTSEEHLLDFRAGFSLVNTNLLLGEDENSFAYCSNGKKANNGEFTEYGKPFKLDDVIGCYLDLESSPCKIHFTLNGEELGTAFEFDKEILGENGGLFPHVLTKGYEFQVNFADNENLLGNAERPTRRRRNRRSNSQSRRSKSRSKSEEKRNSKEKEKDKDKPQQNDGETWDDDVDMNEEKSKGVEKSEEKQAETIEETWDASAENKKMELDIDGEDSRKESEVETENKNDSSEKNPEEKKNDKKENDGWEIIEPEPRPIAQLLPDYQLIALIPEDRYISGLQRPESRKECEVLLMVGLPGAGKTHWVQKYIKENSDKKFDIIGVDELINKMKIDGKPRKDCHNGKWEKVYDLCLKSLTTLEEIATKRRRNYILDQTNVFASDQRRKMKGFGDFKRIAVVCIPNEEELKRRNELNQETGYKEHVKESTLNRMKANFTLPSVEFGWFDEVRYTDLEGDEAKDEVKKYNEKGNRALEASEPSKYKRQRRDNYRRDDRRRHDDRRRYDDRGSRWKNNDRRGSNNRWGPPGNRGGQWRDDRGYGGGGYDRRNDRYSGGGNWVYNNRRYDDRFYRSQGGGGGGNRYDYGGGRDYGRDHRYDRDRNGSSSGGGSSSRRESGSSSSHHRGGSQRDFLPGHRDNRSEDSRGGYERSSSSKYLSSDSYHNDHKNGRSGSSSSKSTNNASSNHQKSQWVGSHSSSQQSQNSPMQQQQNWNTVASGQQHVSYWNYDPQNSYGAYGNHQQNQWPVNSADPRQQQQWMNWWQQQQGNGNNQQQQQQQQYWAQYASYSSQHDPQLVAADGGSDGHSRSDSKK